MSEYRVQLDIYNGPMDLLLYLIRKDEVDIYDIPIASVTDQYLKHIEMMHGIDPNMAGEFLVLAAQLMEIKSRMLLPRQESAEGGGEEFDPRSELVRQLLEYKRFKDAASWLAEAAEQQSMKFPRVPVMPQLDPGEIEIENLQIWDLVEAFGKLMQQTMASAPMHNAGSDDTPISLYQIDILDLMERFGPMPFSRVFEGRTRRIEMIGLFLAMLELVREKRIRIEQDQPGGEIYLFPRGESLAENTELPMAEPVEEENAKPKRRRKKKTDDVAAADSGESHEGVESLAEDAVAALEDVGHAEGDNEEDLADFEDDLGDEFALPEELEARRTAKKAAEEKIASVELEETAMIGGSADEIVVHDEVMAEEIASPHASETSATTAANIEDGHVSQAATVDETIVGDGQTNIESHSSASEASSADEDRIPTDAELANPSANDDVMHEDRS